VLADGGDGYDFVLGSIVADAASTNVLDIAMHAAAEGDITLAGDTVYVSVLDIGGNATLGPSGHVLVDGGLQGDDWCGFFGNKAHKSLNCEAGPR
jgi:hypothetical protein